MAPGCFAGAVPSEALSAAKCELKDSVFYVRKRLELQEETSILNDSNSSLRKSGEGPRCFSRKQLSCRAFGPSARQARELRHGELFGPFGRIDAGFAEHRFRIRRQRLQALAQHLAALAEGGFGDFFQIA